MTQLSCHCGAVELEVTLAENIADAARCDCSFCRRRGVPALTVKKGDLRVTKGAENLTLYSFGTHTAQHHFCKICGVYTHHQRRSNPNEYGVNMAAIKGVNPRNYDPLKWNDGVNHPSDAK